jgi:hypothetical protein
LNSLVKISRSVSESGVSPGVLVFMIICFGTLIFCVLWVWVSGRMFLFLLVVLGRSF